MILEAGRLPQKGDPFPLWSSTMTLPAKGMTDSINYQAGLWRDLAAYLQGMWREFKNGFTALRIEDAFGKRLVMLIHGAIGHHLGPGCGFISARPFQDPQQ